EALGGLLFAPRWTAGALVLAALLWHSRIAATLAAIGALVAVAATFAFPAFTPLAPLLMLNAMLAAVAIGGVWFVPSPSSFALAAMGALAASAVALAIAAPFARAGIAPAILPFNAAVWLVLVAARTRANDRAPKSVDFAPGSPEENLAHFQTRLARFR